MDLLHRSRLQFPGMGMGFLKRLLDEGLTHCRTRLVGGRSLFTYDIAGRTTVDSRPFQIFEGSNDILYHQISEAVLKLMRRAKERNLLPFLRGHDLTSRASEQLKELLNFEVDLKIPQRKLVDLGKAMGRIVTMEMVLQLGDRGFRSDLIANAISMLRHEITGLLSTYKAEDHTLAVDDYEEGGSWLALVSPGEPPPSPKRSMG